MALVDYIVLSPLRKGFIGINPNFSRCLHPDINVGVSIRILEDTANHLPRPLGRGIWNKNIFGVLTPFRSGLIIGKARRSG